MNQFIKYLSNKYGFNTENELNLYQESAPVKTKEETFEHIISEVSIHSGINRDAITGRSRKREIMYARHLIVYAMHKTRLFSLKEIGLKMGGRNHATIINSKEVVGDLISVKDDIMYPLYLKIKHLINENNTSSRTV
jgi:chromosomal replication initiator protein